MAMRKNLQDQTFGRLTAISYISRKVGNKDRSRWLCRCVCGTEVLQPPHALTSGKVKSCGCLWSESRRQRNIERSMPYTQAAENDLYAKIRTASKQRNLDFNLSKADFTKIINSPCIYCGLVGSNTHISSRILQETYKYNGIDRFDNSKGYINGNCVPCCKECNYLKNDIPLWLAQKITTLITLNTDLIQIGAGK